MIDNFSVTDRLLLHELVAVPAQDRQVLARGHRPGAVHARDIRVRMAEKGPTVVVRVERREQGRQGRSVRPHQEPEEG